MGMVNKRVGFLLVALSLVACVNPYAKFYRGKPDGRAVDNYVPTNEPIQIFSSNDFKADAATLAQRGYSAIGESSFNAPANRVSEGQLRDQAQKLGAAVVLVSSRYASTVNGAMPFTMPNNSTSYTTGTATVTGMGGVATVNGSATTNTYGTQTVMVPYSIQRNDFDAVYFVKVRPHFGAVCGPINDELRARLQTNAGVLIKVIVTGSPAARADILPGDVILTMDGRRVDSWEDLNAYLKSHYGEAVTFGIDRNGTELKKTVNLLPP